MPVATTLEPQKPATPPSSPPIKGASPEPPKGDHGSDQTIKGTSATHIPDDDPFKAQDEDIAAKFRAAEGTKPEPPKPPSESTPPKKDDSQAKSAPPVPPKTEGGKMRAELERLSSELKAKNDQYSALESKFKEVEAKGQNTDKLVERMTNLEKEISLRDGQIRRLRKERSPDFIKNHQKPFDNAAEDAKVVFEQLAVISAVDEEGKPTATRPAQWNTDFSTIFAMDRANAKQRAKQLFGDDFDTVMGFYDDLHRRQREMQRALKEEQDNAEKLDKEEEATRLQRQEEHKGTLARVDKDLTESVEGYHDPADDTELAAERKKGYDLWSYDPKTYKEAVLKEAHIKHRAAAYLPNQLMIARLRKEVADLKAEVEKHKKPNPPLGKTKTPGGEGGGKPQEKSWEEEAREILSNA